jgi:hypothetical protein
VRVDDHLALLRFEQQGVHVKGTNAPSKARTTQQIDVNREAFTPVAVEL